jgi:hypothetical protein
MKRKEFIIVNCIVLFAIVAFGALTINLSSNDNLSGIITSLFGRKDGAAIQQVEADSNTRCSNDKPLGLPANGTDPYLTKLQDYQELCGSRVTKQLMIFTGFSGTTNEAKTDAVKMAEQLKTFKDAGVTPIVVAEPYTTAGAVSYKGFIAGQLDASLDQYFKSLKDAGVTDDMMGMWVPFPETNTPNWDNKDTEPRDFSLCVNKYVGALKKHFPKAKASVLLNATTYDPNDIEYNNGDYISLLPYLQDITKGTIDSIGIQGFPWVSNATTERREIFRASEFLQPELAIEAARELRIRDIWYNTGSFASKYTNNEKRRVNITANERKAILNDILLVAKSTENYQQNEYRVFVNLFSEDKSTATEATDWAYFQDAENKEILKEFVTKADRQELPIALYDKAK